MLLQLWTNNNIWKWSGRISYALKTKQENVCDLFYWLMLNRLLILVMVLVLLITKKKRKAPCDKSWYLQDVKSWYLKVGSESLEVLVLIFFPLSWLLCFSVIQCSCNCSNQKWPKPFVYVWLKWPFLRVIKWRRVCCLLCFLVWHTFHLLCVWSHISIFWGTNTASIYSQQGRQALQVCTLQRELPYILRGEGIFLFVN